MTLGLGGGRVEEQWPVGSGQWPVEQGLGVRGQGLVTSGLWDTQGSFGGRKDVASG